MATAAPASASARTIAAPMPREPPVTNAVRPRICCIVMHVSGQNCTSVKTITLPPPKPLYGWNGPCFRHLRLQWIAPRPPTRSNRYEGESCRNRGPDAGRPDRWPHQRTGGDFRGANTSGADFPHRAASRGGRSPVVLDVRGGHERASRRDRKCLRPLRGRASWLAVPHAGIALRHGARCRQMGWAARIDHGDLL